MKFRFLYWFVVIGRIKEPAQKTQPPPSKKEKNKYKPQKCISTGKVMMPEALAKLRAKELAPKTPGGYMRAYKCQFCEAWHLTHRRRLW